MIMQRRQQYIDTIHVDLEIFVVKIFVVYVSHENKKTLHSG